MKLSQLENNIKNKKSFLCLGLDSDIDKIPKHLLDNSDPVFDFNKILMDCNRILMGLNRILIDFKSVLLVYPPIRLLLLLLLKKSGERDMYARYPQH